MPIVNMLQHRGHMTTHSEGRVEDVVQVDGEEVEEPLATCRGHSVAGVVYVRPGIGALS